MCLVMIPEFAAGQNVPEWLQRYRNPMDGSRNWFHHQVAQLPLAEGASHKYSENGKAKPLEGISLVTFIDPESELFQNLTLETQHLKEEYKKAGLADMFAFLPENTWHITVADIVTTQDSNLQKRLEEKVNSAFSTVQKEYLSSSQFHLRSDFVVSAGISVVCLAEPGNIQDLSTIHRIREEVVREVKPIGVPMQDPENFIGHVTIAYFTKPFGVEEYAGFKNIAQTGDVSRRLLGEMSIKQVELRHFLSMEDWGEKPLAILRLNI